MSLKPIESVKTKEGVVRRLNELAYAFGYDNYTDIPKRDIEKFVDSVIDEFKLDPAMLRAILKEEKRRTKGQRKRDRIQAMIDYIDEAYLGKVKIPIRHPGTMTSIANEMGYERVTDIPKSKIPEYARRLVERYGWRSAWMKVKAQVIFRKRAPKRRKDVQFFNALLEEIEKLKE